MNHEKLNYKCPPSYAAALVAGHKDILKKYFLSTFDFAQHRLRRRITFVVPTQ